MHFVNINSQKFNVPKSIDELPAPFPLPAFITFHSLSLPSVAFHCLLSPFIVFHYLSSPPHLIVRPLSAPPFCPRLSPLSHHAPLSSPRPVLSSPRPVLSSPRPTLSPCPFYPRLAPFCPRLAAFCPPLAPFCPHLAPFYPRLVPFCPHLAPLSRHAPAFPRFTLASLLLHHPPLFHTAVFHAPLSAPLCFTHSILLHPFVLLPPPLLYSLPLFCTRFLLPGNLRKPVPGTAKGNVFLIFQRNFAKSP